MPTVSDAADKTPEVTGGVLPNVAPETLASRLLGGLEPLPGLPPAYAVDTTEILRTDPAMPKLDRAVRYTLKGPDHTNTVTFYLHKTAVDAQEDFGMALAGATQSEQVEGFGYTARVLNFGSADRQLGTTRILVLTGQAVIESVSSVAAQSPFGDFRHAAEIVRVAIAYFEDVVRR